MKSLKVPCAVLTLATVSFAASDQLITTLTFKTVSVPSAVQTEATGVDNAGDIVGFYVDSRGVDHGFIDTAGKITTINVPDSVATHVYGISEKGTVRLPTVADLFPEIVNPKLDKRDKLPSCSAIEALQRQEPFVNQTLAYQALAMLGRLFRYGRISYHGGSMNIATGRTSSLPVDPAVWQRIAKHNQ